jgi:hypothetical protein
MSVRLIALLIIIYGASMAAVTGDRWFAGAIALGIVVMIIGEKDDVDRV